MTNASILSPYGVSLVTSDTSMGEDSASSSYQTDNAMCMSEVLDTTLGMQELEDTVAETQWHNSETYGQEPFLHSVHIRGISMKKSHAIAQQF